MPESRHLLFRWTVGQGAGSEARTERQEQGLQNVEELEQNLSDETSEL